MHGPSQNNADACSAAIQTQPKDPFVFSTNFSKEIKSSWICKSCDLRVCLDIIYFVKIENLLLKIL